MSCIIPSSKEFKQLLEKTGYTESYLKNLIYEFQSLYGENKFPSYLDIEVLATPKPYESDAKIDSNGNLVLSEVDKTWITHATPTFGGDIAGLEESATWLEKIFGYEGVRITEKQNGVHKLEVARPNWLPYALNDSLYEVLEEQSKDSTLIGSQLLKLMLDVIRKRDGKLPNIVVNRGRRPIERTLPNGKKESLYALMDANTDTINIYIQDLAKSLIAINDPESRRYFFLARFIHELGHVITIQAIANAEAGIGTPEEVALYNEIERLRKLTIESVNEETQSLYGLTNAHEFIAEVLSQRSFQRVLSTIKDTKTHNKLLKIVNKVFSALANFIRSITRTSVENSVLESALTSIGDYLTVANTTSSVKRSLTTTRAFGEKEDSNKPKKLSTKEELLEKGRFTIDGNTFEFTEFNKKLYIVCHPGTPASALSLVEEQILADNVKIANNLSFERSSGERYFLIRILKPKKLAAENTSFKGFSSERTPEEQWALDRLKESASSSKFVKAVESGKMSLQEALEAYEKEIGQSIFAASPAEQTPDLPEDVTGFFEKGSELSDEEIISKDSDIVDGIINSPRTNKFLEIEIPATEEADIEGVIDELLSEHIFDDVRDDEVQEAAGSIRDLVLWYKFAHLPMDDTHSSFPLVENLKDSFGTLCTTGAIPTGMPPLVQALSLGRLKDLSFTELLKILPINTTLSALVKWHNIPRQEMLGLRKAAWCTINYLSKNRSELRKFLYGTENDRLDSVIGKSAQECSKEEKAFANEIFKYLVSQEANKKMGELMLFPDLDKEFSAIVDQADALPSFFEASNDRYAQMTPVEFAKELSNAIYSSAMGISFAQALAKTNDTAEMLEKGPQETTQEKNPSQETEQENAPAESSAEEAPTQEKSPKQQFEEDPFVQYQQRIQGQLNNLYGNENITASEIRHFAEQVVYWISDHISELQTDKDLVTDLYGEIFKGKDLSKMTRMEIIATIGVNNIVNICKRAFERGKINIDSRKSKKKLSALLENFDAILLLAQDIMLNVEDFTFATTSDGKTMEVNNERSANPDDPNYVTDSSQILETEGSLQEHWQVESRTLHILDTASALVRRALLKFYLKNEDGSIVKSEFGINERVAPRKAINAILRWTQGSLNMLDMINELKEKQAFNPWLDQLIAQLEDKSGQYSDFQSQFYATFAKHFQRYSIIVEKNGKFISMLVNEKPALEETIKQINTRYKVGEHPLFTLKGISEETLKKLEDILLKKINDLGNVKNPAGTNSFRLATLSEGDLQSLKEAFTEAASLLGYITIPEMLNETLTQKTLVQMRTNLWYIVNSLKKHIGDVTYNPFEFDQRDSIQGNLRSFLQPFTETLEDVTASSVYSEGKTYQSYVTPSYMTKLMLKFAEEDQDKFMAFINQEYGKYPWFRTQTKGNQGGWRNGMLRMLIQDEDTRKAFAHKVQLTFNGQVYMKGMDELAYTLSLLTEYNAYKTNKKSNTTLAWFRIPMISNKPSSEFIRWYSYRGENYREQLTLDYLYPVFLQELSRIQTVRARNKKKGDKGYIKNWDENGRKFCFLTFLNDFLPEGAKNRTEVGKLIEKKLSGNELSSEENAKLMELVTKEIISAVEANAEATATEWMNKGIATGCKKIQNMGTTDEEIKASIINYLWNDFTVASNILQLTITDLAFYADAEDLQKRLAQIHAPGIRANTEARDYKGRIVSDGIHRTIYIKNFDKVLSNVIANLEAVFLKKIAEAPQDQKASLTALMESLIGEINPKTGKREGGAYRDIDVTDGQGYSCPTSYRKKAFMFGKWSQEAETLYQKIIKGEASYSEIKLAFQPLKPFLYSQTAKDTGVTSTNPNLLNVAKVPVQNKNSEYLLILADAILQGAGQANLLSAIYEVMEESHFESGHKGDLDYYKLDGIDTVQFDSTVKSGWMTPVNINAFIDLETSGTDQAAYFLRKEIYKESNREGEEGELEYDADYVHEFSAEDYCIQQEIPEHFIDHFQAQGSQGRFLSIGNLLSVNPQGEPYKYKITTDDGTIKEVSAEEFRSTYESTIAANIDDSIEEVQKLFNLDKLDHYSRNTAISKILQREILNNIDRYGVDLLLACSLDSDGNFRIPLSDPVQSKRVEQLLHSIIKTRINKQEIAGGPVVQVTNFGTSKRLEIRFKDSNGNLLMTKREFEEHKKRMRINTPIKAKYRGKLIFAASGTGKTSIADNRNVIDSDALLGNILGVHPNLAGKAFQVLPMEDRGRISREYEKAIKDALAEGKTVITGRVKSLKDADVIIYDSNAESADERTSREDRVNPYSQKDYHQSTIDRIATLRETDELKEDAEVIKLKEGEYLATHLLDDPNFNLKTATVKQYDTIDQALDVFMDNFGISIEEMTDAGYSIDYLERVIKGDTEEARTRAAGTMIAFMMQYDRKVIDIVTKLALEDPSLDADIKSALQKEIDQLKADGNKTATFKFKVYKDLEKTKYFDIIGKAISQELNRQFNNIKEDKTDDEASQSFLDAVRTIIKNFFDWITNNIEVLDEIFVFSRYISNQVLQNNPAAIAKEVLKPGDEDAGLVSRVNIVEAVSKFPYESDIIEKLMPTGVKLAGSAALAVQTEVFRPTENPLHDLDFDAGMMDRETLEQKITPLFENLEHVRTIKNDTYVTETYLTSDVPFTLEEVLNEEGKVETTKVIEKDTNELLATFKGNTITLTDYAKQNNIKCKFLDFFTKNQLASKYKGLSIDAGGFTINFSNWRAAMAAKLSYSRPKDFFDYVRAKPLTFTENTSYEKYCRDNQKSVAYLEAFAPIYSRELLQPFMDNEGTINMKAIELVSPELLKLISYRIPTEAKYSMAPIKIVGFMPEEAGDAIMLPFEITLMTGADFDIDKEYIMRKEFDFGKKNVIGRRILSEADAKENEESLQKGIRGALFKSLIDSQKGKFTDGKVPYSIKQEINQIIDLFLEDPLNARRLVGGKSIDTTKALTIPARAYEKMLKIYFDKMYYFREPKAGTRAARNNKIIDMTYEALTHEVSFEELFTPGGFDDQKKLAYAVAAYKDPQNTKSLEELSAMSLDELKKLSSKSKNLLFTGTHVNFYRQNSAAGTLIGIFAVHNLAHSILSADGYRVDVNGALGLKKGESFKVMGYTFSGKMPIAAYRDSKGRTITKVLASLVASSVDAVKDPILNLLNINPKTANALLTMIKMGMLFEDIATLLSTRSMENLLASYNKANINGYQTLMNVLKDRIEKLTKQVTTGRTSPVFSEDLTKDEVIKNLRQDDPIIELKILSAFQKFMQLSEALQPAVFATRYNAISSAAGPQIIDTIVKEEKRASLDENSLLFDNNGKNIKIEDILKRHPILNSFAKSYDVVHQIFNYNPLLKEGGAFKSVISSLSLTTFGKSLLNDRKLLGQLADFFLSFIAVKKRVINPEQLNYYINEFPKEFMTKDIQSREDLKDNLLIKGIRYNTDKRGRLTLVLNISGLESTERELLQSAWIDLHKKDPELSLDLFRYCFFRGGLGFSPKTFMALLPVFVKERINNYTSSFNNSDYSEIDPIDVIDQFVTNNLRSDKLCPRLKIASTNSEGFITVTIQNLKRVGKSTPPTYFKRLDNNNEYHLYKLIDTEFGVPEEVPKTLVMNSDTVLYKEMPILGDNKDYLEILDGTTPIGIPAELIKKSTEKSPNKDLESPEQSSTQEQTTPGQMQPNSQAPSENTMPLAERATAENAGDLAQNGEYGEGSPETSEGSESDIDLLDRTLTQLDNHMEELYESVLGMTMPDYIKLESAERKTRTKSMQKAAEDRFVEIFKPRLEAEGIEFTEEELRKHFRDLC